MTRSLVAVAAAAATTTALLAVPTAAQAAPGGVQMRYTSTQTSARYTSGTGLIRAWQDCEASRGQTIFRQYGSWKSINNWSTAGRCTTRILRRGSQTSTAS